LPTNRCAVRCAEKPEFVWWPLRMPPALCTASAPGQCHAIPHENSPNTPSIALDSWVPAKSSLDTLGCAPVFVSPAKSGLGHLGDRLSTNRAHGPSARAQSSHS
jgi:hypothetical protein